MLLIRGELRRFAYLLYIYDSMNTPEMSLDTLACYMCTSVIFVKTRDQFLSEPLDAPSSSPMERLDVRNATFLQREIQRNVSYAAISWLNPFLALWHNLQSCERLRYDLVSKKESLPSLPSCSSHSVSVSCTPTIAVLMLGRTDLEPSPAADSMTCVDKGTCQWLSAMQGGG